MKMIVVTCGETVETILNVDAVLSDNTDAIAARVLRNLVHKYFPELPSEELNLIERNKVCRRTDNRERVWTFSICDSVPVQNRPNLLVSPPRFKESDYFSSDWENGVILCNKEYAIDKIIGQNDILYDSEEIGKEIKKLKGYNIFNEDGELLDAGNNYGEMQFKYDKMVS